MTCLCDRLINLRVHTHRDACDMKAAVRIRTSQILLALMKIQAYESKALRQKN
jgi:hypothetical protein